MNSVSEKIKNECLDGMDFERILEIYNLYIDVNQYKPCELNGVVVKELTLEQWNQIIE